MRSQHIPVRRVPALSGVLIVLGFFHASVFSWEERSAPIESSAPRPDGIQWPSFRGWNASGIAEGYKTPAHWDVEAGRNVRWKTPIPGLGHSSPIIWNERIFVTAAVSERGNQSLRIGVFGDIAPVEDDSLHQFVVYCLDKRSGRILWEQAAHEGVPKIKRHSKSTHANSTPATNGKYVVAFFGSEGLYCYDMEGTLIWKKDLGLLDSGFFRFPAAQWGFGSSPIIHDGRVVIQCDVQGEDFLAAFDLETGGEIWRTSREEVPTWSTPALFIGQQTTQIVVNGYRQIGAYDFRTGASLWQMEGGGDIPVATPVVGHGLVFITNHHGGQTPVYAIDPLPRSSAGKTAPFHIVWQAAKEGAYLQTPILYGDYFYCSKYGILRCFKARTGQLMHETRLRGSSYDVGFTPSPVAANGILYFTSEPGEVLLLEAGPEFKILAENTLGEICMATPAISEGILFFRTKDHLIAIADP